MMAFVPSTNVKLLGAAWLPDKSPLTDSSHCVTLWACALVRKAVNANMPASFSEHTKTLFAISPSGLIASLRIRGSKREDVPRYLRVVATPFPLHDLRSKRGGRFE